MWLINTETLQIEEVLDSLAYRYAILSHTWGAEEVSFRDIQDLDYAKTRKGFEKIEMTCQIAKTRGLNYVWVDTCCIDKSSSAELSEAINSMFRWYREAVICFVYLSDASKKSTVLEDALRSSRWMTRGWTLQELLAPAEINFYDSDWRFYGTKAENTPILEQITGIDRECLTDSRWIFSKPIGYRMSWAANRRTSRLEDMAYCLLGIFDINMPMLYGEGEKAFARLQEQICEQTHDMSLFAWQAERSPQAQHTQEEFRGVFAKSPREFRHLAHNMGYGRLRRAPDLQATVQSYSVTNKGVRMENAPLVSAEDNILAIGHIFTHSPTGAAPRLLGIYMTPTANGFVRKRPQELAFLSLRTQSQEWRTFLVKKAVSLEDSLEMDKQARSSIEVLFLNRENINVLCEPFGRWDQCLNTFITNGRRFQGYLDMRVPILNLGVFLIFGLERPDYVDEDNTGGQSDQDLIDPKFWCIIEGTADWEWWEKPKVTEWRESLKRGMYITDLQPYIATRDPFGPGRSYTTINLNKTGYSLILTKEVLQEPLRYKITVDTQNNSAPPRPVANEGGWTDRSAQSGRKADRRVLAHRNAA